MAAWIAQSGQPWNERQLLTGTMSYFPSLEESSRPAAEFEQVVIFHALMPLAPTGGFAFTFRYAHDGSLMLVMSLDVEMPGT